MDEAFPFGMSMNPIIHFFMKWLKQLAVSLWRDERTRLRPKICTGYKYRGRLIAYDPKNFLEIFYRNFTLALKYFLNEVPT